MSTTLGRRPRTRLVGTLVLLAALTLAACANASGVSTLGAAESDGNPFTPPEEILTGSTAPVDPDDTTPEPPPPTVPGRTTELLDAGVNKPSRPYDDLVEAALNDIEVFWAEQYPAIYGEPFQPLEGRVYAGYPERTTPIPGCGPDDETTYDELIFYAAFYCPDGDFIVYDDGHEGLLYYLAEALGPSVIAVVLAHEYGHAIQYRFGGLDRNIDTIYTEQQADCFSGAWVGRVVGGDAPGVTMTDNDVRAGLIALIEVRDPIGIDQLTPGGHGSGFDRVGAFQVGFLEGAPRCAELLDDPLPLMPNIFIPGSEGDGDGNAPYGYDPEANQIPGFAATALNDYWTAVLGESFGSLTLVPFDSIEEVRCDEALLGDPEIGALLCTSSSTVYIEEPLAQELYAEFGDFALGYMLGSAWSDAAQVALESPLQGEERALLNDCLVGAWTATLVPDEEGNVVRGTVYIEPGDLDEAIQTVIRVGDPKADDDILGSAFEKVSAFRQGVLNGVSACQAMLDD
ncbi:MAG: hypothetical protein ACK5OX_17545 [Desertimonas sp.]